MKQYQLDEKFAAIMTANLPMVVAYARRRLPEDFKCDAEDFANEAFFNFWKYIVKLGYVPQIKNTGAFLRIIVLNVIRSHFRKKQSLFDLTKTWLAEVVFHSTNSADDSLAILEQIELRDDLLRSIDHLPPVQHDCVTLRYINELEFSEIALLLNTSVNNVRVNAYRGIKRLREIYPNRKEGE